MPTVTLTNLSNRVYSRLDNNTGLYPQSNVTNSLNESVRVFNLYLGMLQTTVAVPGFSDPNRIWYDVPVGILIPQRVQFEGQYLNKMFPNQIGKAYSNWVQDTTTSTGMPVSEWVPCGFSKFGIHPADSTGGGAIIVTGIAEPTLLVHATDTVAIPNEYTDTLVNLTAQVLTLKETGKLFTQQMNYYGEFLRLMKKAGLWRGMIMPQMGVETTQKN